MLHVWMNWWTNKPNQTNSVRHAMQFYPILYWCLFDISVRNLSKGWGATASIHREFRHFSSPPSMALLHQFVPDNVLISHPSRFYWVHVSVNNLAYLYTVLLSVGRSGSSLSNITCRNWKTVQQPWQGMYSCKCLSIKSTHVNTEVSFRLF